MAGFAQAVAAWHDFYVMIGTAAATLVGLLFVALSLNVDAIAGDSARGLRLLATQPFTNFLTVLAFAIVFLIPNQDPYGLGLPLIGVGLLGLYVTVRRLVQVRRIRAGKVRVVRALVTPIVYYVVLIAVAVSVLFGRTNELYWLVPVMILLIVEASVVAWRLLFETRGRPGN